MVSLLSVMRYLEAMTKPIYGEASGTVFRSVAIPHTSCVVKTTYERLLTAKSSLSVSVFADPAALRLRRVEYPACVLAYGNVR